MLDLQQTKDAHIDQRLREDLIVWLGSVKTNGHPHLVPVWFLWDGQSVLIFSQPNNQKIRNIQHEPHVTLALDNTKVGGDVVIIEGVATLEDTEPDQATLENYKAKYGQQIQSMGWTLDSMRKDFSQALRIQPTKFLKF